MARLVPSEYLVGFALVTALFALWGFAHDVTNPMVSAFHTVLSLDNTQSALVQTAFYSGYCVMAIPAALVIKRFTYKVGILIGLVLYSIGCLLFIPAASQAPSQPDQTTTVFATFLLAYFVMTCGMSFLETTANPYILSMGSEETATSRLNTAQAFNPVGSLCGMFVARTFVLGGLDQASESDRQAFFDKDPSLYRSVTEKDLRLIRTPYAILGVVIAVIFVGFLCAKLPQTEGQDKSLDLCGTVTRIARRPLYVKGVLAQLFNVSAQICCWTFIIQYGEDELGLSKASAESFNIVAMVLFVTNRFVCTYLLRFVSAGALLAVAGVLGALLCLGAMLLPHYLGLVSLIAVSACLSPMFPTIYGIALEGLGDDAKLASAGLIMAIGGGAILPPVQGAVIDAVNVRVSFVVPLVCFLLVAAFGLDVLRSKRAVGEKGVEEICTTQGPQQEPEEVGREHAENDVVQQEVV